MKKYIVIFLCLAGLAMAQGYSDWQLGAIEGLKYGFKMGQAFTNAQNGINVTGFNAEVDSYNAWIRKNFGENPSLLMSKMNAPMDLSRPVMVANNTSSNGIVHEIDGGAAGGPSYTTNDINLLPENARNQLLEAEYDKGKVVGYKNPTAADYLGGI